MSAMQPAAEMYEPECAGEPFKFPFHHQPIHISTATCGWALFCTIITRP